MQKLTATTSNAHRVDTALASPVSGCEPGLARHIRAPSLAQNDHEGEALPTDTDASRKRLHLDPRLS